MRLSILWCLTPLLQPPVASCYDPQHEHTGVLNAAGDGRTSNGALSKAALMRKMDILPGRPSAEHMLATDSASQEHIWGPTHDVHKDASLLESAHAFNSSAKPTAEMSAEEEQRLSNLVEQWLQSMVKWQTLIVSLSLVVISSGMMRTRQDKVKPRQVKKPNQQALVELLGKLGLPSKRTLGFMVLWLSLAIMLAGFAPAYILRFLGQPWYFDAARKLGPNVLPGWSSVHAVMGAAWAGVMIHQTITAYLGTKQDFLQPAHRIVGRFGWFVAALCSATGIYILVFGSLVSRIPELQQVILIGIYATGNAVIGVVYVRRGQVQAHKQCMGWSIIWTASPGVLRLANYIIFSFVGQACPTDCLNLLKTQVPYFCNISAFVSTQCGIGYIVPEIALFVSWGAGILLWALWGCSHWEVLAGNSTGWLLQLVTGDVMKRFAVQTIVGGSVVKCTLCQ